MKNPTPWYYGEGYDQCDPGVYICDANRAIVVADTTENTLTVDTAKRICDAVNASAVDPLTTPRPIPTVRVMVGGLATTTGERPIVISTAEEWRAYFGAHSQPPEWFTEPSPMTMLKPDAKP